MDDERPTVNIRMRSSSSYDLEGKRKVRASLFCTSQSEVCEVTILYEQLLPLVHVFDSEHPPQDKEPDSAPSAMDESDKASQLSASGDDIRSMQQQPPGQRARALDDDVCFV